MTRHYWFWTYFVGAPLGCVLALGFVYLIGPVGPLWAQAIGGLFTLAGMGVGGAYGIAREDRLWWEERR